MTSSTRPAAFAALLVFAASPVAAAEPIELITAEEARLPAAASAGGQARNLTRGPAVDPVAPPAIGVKTGPFRFAVRFKPRNGVPVDPSRVKVTYRRAPSVDLSERVKPFVSAAGIEAPAVVAPAGTHVIDIEATDMENRVGRGQITVTVEDR